VQTLLQVTGISKRFGGVRALQGVSFDLLCACHFPRMEARHAQADLIGAWEKAGAKFGWMSLEERGPGFLVFRQGPEGKPGEMPAFRLYWFPQGVAKLPVLGATKLTDADLEELAGMKLLQCLDLHDTKVTDTGANELQRALPGLIIQR
jgi:hypothetical protein